MLNLLFNICRQLEIKDLDELMEKERVYILKRYHNGKHVALRGLITSGYMHDNEYYTCIMSAKDGKTTHILNSTKGASWIMLRVSDLRRLGLYSILKNIARETKGSINMEIHYDINLHSINTI